MVLVLQSQLDLKENEIFYSIPEQPDQNESAHAKIYEQLTSKWAQICKVQHKYMLQEK